ncbi:MAG: hypothetical protein K0R99_3043 [Microbacterium sp.]|jgi:hypothetical protein|uniref:hypothetical protein n=1 Tax=Microbacterium sp. TaxID=51671 RepID=UPI002613B24C|nr:hypothetical protein [Microbacterium sp.]MDF2561597.1 hypothetical protein [Microbacterium sp.]
MSRSRRRFKLGVAASGVAVALGLLVAPSAHAAWETGSANCQKLTSYTSAGGTQSVTHYHELPGEWKRVTRPAGFGSFYGFYNGGPTWMEISSAGYLSSPYMGCRR